MTNALKFIQLQDKANQEIDELGQVTNETCEQLEQLCDSLNSEEIDEVCYLFSQKQLELC